MIEYKDYFNGGLVKLSNVYTLIKDIFYKEREFGEMCYNDLPFLIIEISKEHCTEKKYVINSTSDELD